MKIADIVVHVLTKPMDSSLWNPRTKWHEKNVLLVRVETDAGIAGLGEAWCEGSLPASTKTFIEEDVRPLLIGEDPLYIGRIFDHVRETGVISAKRGILAAAQSAIDIALWDILGKLSEQPIFKLLGARRDRVFVYASGGLYARGKTPDALGKEMAQYTARGFRGVKIKIGGLPLSEDVARVAAVREAIGPDTRLMIDAVYNYTVPQAIKAARAFEPYDIYFFEAPISHNDHEGLAKLAVATSIPIAGNEVEFGLPAYRRLLDTGAVSYIQADTILCGGISEAAAIAAVAASKRVPFSYHSSSSAVAFAANMHAAAAAQFCDSVEWHTIHQLLFDLVGKEKFHFDDGYVVLPSSPGLGIDLDLNDIRKL
jgi:L-alanine-DL-glutamate epimerase-like enolase superfamily enzyme